MARRIVDGAMPYLLKMWLEAPVEEIDERGTDGDQGERLKQRTARSRDEERGTPQAAPISPLLSNLCTRRFVPGWKTLGHAAPLHARIVNYADDFVICCRGPDELVGQLSRVLRGRAGEFCLGPVSDTCRTINAHIRYRFRKGWGAKHKNARFGP